LHLRLVRLLRTLFLGHVGLRADRSSVGHATPDCYASAAAGQARADHSKRAHAAVGNASPGCSKRAHSSTVVSGTGTSSDDTRVLPALSSRVWLQRRVLRE
jgi:hypothetical protein